VYRWHDEDAATDLAAFVPRARDLSHRVQAARTVAALARLVANDLEASVVARRPEVGALRDRLLAEGALAAGMTGSGAASFGIFADAEAARRARAALAPTRAWHVTDLQPLRAGGGPELGSGQRSGQ
jgi:4-diphosphocytidyl-2C-methyl-D-erythritol kinase